MPERRPRVLEAEDLHQIKWVSKCDVVGRRSFVAVAVLVLRDSQIQAILMPIGTGRQECLVIHTWASVISQPNKQIFIRFV